MTWRGRVRPLGIVGAGGFAGAVLRHAVAVVLSAPFPWGTLAANVGGTALLALLLSDARLGDALDPETRLLVGTGFCSSFTTYSTFAAETVALAPELAAVNVAANYGLGVGAVVLGRLAAGWLS